MKIFFKFNNSYYQSISEPYQGTNRPCFLAIDITTKRVRKFPVSVLTDDVEVFTENEEIYFKQVVAKND